MPAPLGGTPWFPYLRKPQQLSRANLNEMRCIASWWILVLQFPGGRKFACIRKAPGLSRLDIVKLETYNMGDVGRCWIKKWRDDSLKFFYSRYFIDDSKNWKFYRTFPVDSQKELLNYFYSGKSKSLDSFPRATYF